MGDLTQLEMAVTTVVCHDPSVSNEIRQQANDYCDAFQRSPEGWRHSCAKLIERSRLPNELSSTTTPDRVSTLNEWLLHIRFWYAKVITERVLQITPVERAEVRRCLMIFITEIIPWRAATFSKIIGIKSPEVISVDNFAVLRKMALLYVRCMIADYPKGWPEGGSLLVSLWRQKKEEYQKASQSTTGIQNHTEDLLEFLVVKQTYISITQFVILVMETFDDEIIIESVSRSIQERNRCMEVKDALREGDILLFAKFWLEILDDFHKQPESSNHEIVSQTLRLLSKFFVWVDIQIIANEKFLAHAFRLFDRESQCGPAAIDLVGALFNKRMDPGQRIIMCHKLRLLDELITRIGSADFGISNIHLSDKNGSCVTYSTDMNCMEPGAYSVKLADTLNLVGLQLLESLVELRKGYENSSSFLEEADQDLRRLGGVQAAGLNPFFTPISSPSIWTELQTEAWSMIQKLLPKMCVVYSHPHPDISDAVEPFLSEWTKVAKQMCLDDNGVPFRPSPFALGDQRCPIYIPIGVIRPFIASLLQMTLSCVQYPYWYDFKNVDENENQEAFLEFRKNITLLFKRLYSVDSITSLQFIYDMCQQLIKALESNQIHINQIEAVLHILLTAGESYKDISKELTSYDHTLAECLRLVFSSEKLLHNPHPQIKILLFNLIIRFMAFIQNRQLHPPNSNYNLSILNLFLGARGVLSGCKSYENGTSHFEGSSEVFGHATITLLRFVKANITSIVSFTQQIILEFYKSNLLTVNLFPSNEWPQSTNQSHIVVPKDSSNVCAPRPYEVPNGFPNEPWTFDDQYRCFEMIGYLLGFKDGGLSQEEQVSLLQKLLDPILVPFTRMSEDGSQTKLCQIAQTDPKGVIDFVARLLQVMANISKGFNLNKSLANVWTKCLQAEVIALKDFGKDGRVRAAVVQLTRRMVALLKDSPDTIPVVANLVSSLFDVTLASFIEGPGQTISSDDLRTTAMQEAFDEQDFSELSVAVNIALQHLKELNNSNESKIPSTFSGHQEISQLCVLVNYLIITFKGSSIQGLLMTPVQGFNNQATTLFSRILNQSIDFWKLMPSSSSELLREKAEIHKDTFLMLHALSVNSPSTYLSLLEIELKQQETIGSQTLLDWIASGTQPKCIHSLGAVLTCLQTWITFFVFFLRSHQVKEAVHRIDLETLLFDKLKLSCVVYGIIQTAFLLDMENPQHNKILQETCTLLRLFSGFLPDTTETASSTPLIHHTPLSNRLRQVYLEAIPPLVCSPQDATLVLQAIVEAPTSREAKEVFRKWIVTQQLSVRPQEKVAVA